jgi:prevent-host-death family protein
MATVVNIQEAKTNLSRLIMEAQNGAEVIIANRGKPVVKLSAIERLEKREMGFMKLPPIPDSFFEPLFSDTELDGMGL